MTVIWVFDAEVVGGLASNHLPPTSLNVCHSERSEESFSRSRPLLKKINIFVSDHINMIL